MVEEIAEGILKKVPSIIPVQEVMTKYPVMYQESMNTVLVQEVKRYGASGVSKVLGCSMVVL